MLVWIVRHGKAERDSPSGRDEERALAARGERQADWLGTTIARRADRPGAIVSSPVLRAIETARRVNAALRAPLRESADLIVGRPASRALALIEEFDGAAPLMLVGHNPQLAKLVGLLTTGPGHEAEMKTGMAVLLEVDQDAPAGAAETVETLRLEEDE